MGRQPAGLGWLGVWKTELQTRWQRRGNHIWWCVPSILMESRLGRKKNPADELRPKVKGSLWWTRSMQHIGINGSEGPLQEERGWCPHENNLVSNFPLLISSFHLRTLKPLCQQSYYLLSVLYRISATLLVFPVHGFAMKIFLRLISEVDSFSATFPPHSLLLWVNPKSGLLKYTGGLSHLDRE